MSTPTFKLLLNALRLGQPQDPQAAIRALAEAFAAQDEKIEELKHRISVVQSAAQILEQKAARLEMELEAARHGVSFFQPTQGYQPPQSVSGPQSERPPPMSQQSHQSYRPPAPTGPDRAPASMQQPSQHPSFRPPAPTGQERSPSVMPQQSPTRSNSSVPPPPSAGLQMPLSQKMPGPSAMPNLSSLIGSSDEDSSSDGFGVETVVVHKRDVEALMNPEAPFKLPPPGQRVGPERGSIPGAPWARGVKMTEVCPPMAEEFTVDAFQEERNELEEEGETYRDVGGGVSSLAAALGLSPTDPRLEKIRAMRGQQGESPSASTTPQMPGSRPSPKPRRR